VEDVATPLARKDSKISEGEPLEAKQEDVILVDSTEPELEALPEPLAIAAREASEEAALKAKASKDEHPQALPEALPNQAANEPRPLFYESLQLDLLAGYKDIHVHFLRLVKRHIAAKHACEKSQDRDFRLHLRSLCIAHDILKDPTTRRLYDLNVLGVHRASNSADIKSFKSMENAGIRIGELLQCAEILEPSELAIAVDMHKAMPEMMFGEFMVNQGFVSQPELDDTLLGQKLIEQAKLTVAQFQLAMQQARQRKTNLKPMLIEHQFVQEEDLL
jgi:hypothetical protein